MLKLNKENHIRTINVEGEDTFQKYYIDGDVREVDEVLGAFDGTQHILIIPEEIGDICSCSEEGDMIIHHKEIYDTEFMKSFESLAYANYEKGYQLRWDTYSSIAMYQPIMRITAKHYYGGEEWYTKSWDSYYFSLGDERPSTQEEFLMSLRMFAEAETINNAYSISFESKMRELRSSAYTDTSMDDTLNPFL